MTKTPHVVIVGAGFGGLEVAEHLAHVPVEVTLIDRHNYHTFQPLLYQVATSLLNAEDVGAPVRSMFRHQENVTFRMATVSGVDVAGRTIRLEDGNQLAYDYLVLAGGATVNYFNTPGAAEHAFPLYTLMDAVKLRNHVLDRFEAADGNPNLIQDGELTFVIVGAGPTGVETAGALADLFYNLLPQDYHQLATEKARVIIVEMAKEVLAPFKENLRTYAKQELEQRRVEVRLGRSRRRGWSYLRAFEVRRRNQSPYADLGGRRESQPFGRRDWLAARPWGPNQTQPRPQRPRPPGDLRGWRHGRGCVERSRFCRNSARWRCNPDSTSGDKLPAACMVSQPSHSSIGTKGFMATIGRGAAVVEFPNKRTLHGPLAYFAWLGVHLTLLSGIRNRIEVLWNWSWSALTHDRAARIIIQPKTDDEVQ